MDILEIGIRILVATICGTIIGFDRARHGRNAGIKTHSLVAIGSALAMIIGEILYLKNGEKLDPARIPAQVISGIGFLGAGSIIVTGDKKIVGLTTAATLWLSAIVGMSAGAGIFEATGVAMLAWLFTFTVIKILDKKVIQHSSSVTLYIKMKEPLCKLDLLEILHKEKCDIYFLKEVSQFKHESHYIANVSMDLSITKKILEEKIKKYEGIIYISIEDNEYQR